MRQLILLYAALAAATATAAGGACSSGPAAAAPPVPVPPQSTVRINGAGTPGMTIRTSNDVAPITASVDVAVDSVWRALPKVYEKLGVPLTMLDSSTRTIGNDAFKVRRSFDGVPLMRYFDCGGTPGAPNAETFDIRLALYTQLQAAGSRGTVVATSVQAMGRSPQFSGTEVACGSNGRLEAHINELVVNAVGG